MKLIIERKRILNTHAIKLNEDTEYPFDLFVEVIATYENININLDKNDLKDFIKYVGLEYENT